jgi:hypothetical protein
VDRFRRDPSALRRAAEIAKRAKRAVVDAPCAAPMPGPASGRLPYISCGYIPRGCPPPWAFENAFAFHCASPW